MMRMSTIPRMEPAADDMLLWIKVVPGASRDGCAGLVGDRLKVRVGAPPEAGKANRAVCRVIASFIGVRDRQVTVESGLTSPQKVVRIAGIDLAELTAALE